MRLYLFTPTVDSCPYCGYTRLVLDVERSEIVCPCCGSVIADRLPSLLLESDCDLEGDRKVEARFRPSCTLPEHVIHKLIKVARRISEIMHVPSKRVFLMLVKEYTRCSRLSRRERFYCTLARVVAELAIEKYMSPVMTVKNVVVKLGYRLFNFKLEWIQDSLKMWLLVRKRALMDKIVQVLPRDGKNGNGVKELREQVKKMVDEVYRPDRKAVTIAYEVFRRFGFNCRESYKLAKKVARLIEGDVS